jgi:hypothetical protein
MDWPVIIIPADQNFEAADLHIEAELLVVNTISRYTASNRLSV